MPEVDPWLRDTIKRIDGTLETVRQNQAELITNNADRLARMEARLDKVEDRVARAHSELKREARRWGAVGGFTSGLLAILAACIKALIGRPHP